MPAPFSPPSQQLNAQLEIIVLRQRHNHQASRFTTSIFPAAAVDSKSPEKFQPHRGKSKLPRASLSSRNSIKARTQNQRPKSPLPVCSLPSQTRPSPFLFRRASNAAAVACLCRAVVAQSSHRRIQPASAITQSSLCRCTNLPFPRTPAAPLSCRRRKAITVAFDVDVPSPCLSFPRRLSPAGAVITSLALLLSLVCRKEEKKKMKMIKRDAARVKADE